MGTAWFGNWIFVLEAIPNVCAYECVCLHVCSLRDVQTNLNRSYGFNVKTGQDLRLKTVYLLNNLSLLNDKKGTGAVKCFKLKTTYNVYMEIPVLLYL